MTELTITNCVKSLKAISDCLQSNADNQKKYKKVKNMILDLLVSLTPENHPLEDEIRAKCDDLKEYAQSFNDDGDNLIIKRASRDLGTIFRKLKANEYDDFFNALINVKGFSELVDIISDEETEVEPEITPQEWYGYAFADYQSGDYQAAKTKAEKALEGGYSIAAYLLGILYEKGKGVSVDYLKAFNYFLKGAQAGNAACQYALYLYYKDGTGCVKDVGAALKWLKVAADNGDADAMADWAYHCCVEIDPPRFSEGFAYFSKAAEQGHERGKLMLAFCYENGWGVTLNIEQAKKIYKELMDSGDESAKENYERIIGNEQRQRQDKQRADAARRQQAEEQKARAEAEQRKKNERFGCTFWIVILVLAAIGYGGYKWWYMPYKIDKEAPRTYVFASNLFLRSSKVTDVEYNRIGKIPYGSELITYSDADGWAEVKANGQTGFVASNYLLNYDDFHLLNGVWGNDDTKETIITAKCRLAVLDYLKRNNLKSGKDGWLIYTKPVDTKPNTVFFPRLANGYEYFTEFAFILSNSVTNDRKLAIYSFQEDETPVFVYEENAPSEGDIKNITYSSWSKKKYRVTYTGKKASGSAKQSQSSVQQQPDKVSTGKLEIRRVTFAAVDVQNKIIVPYEQKLYSDMQYLKAQVFFVVGDYAGKTITLQVKIYSPSKQLLTGATSPPGYTFQEQFTITGDANEIKKMILMGWGNQNGRYYVPGEHSYEIWCNGEKLYSTGINVYNKEQDNNDSRKENSLLYEAVDEMPEYPSGGQAGMMRYINMHLKYPTAAQEKGIQGRVTLTFVVEKDGSIKDVRVVKGVDPLLDKEAIRVMYSMPKWKPGKKDGVAVRVKYTVPITFRLE